MMLHIEMSETIARQTREFAVVVDEILARVPTAMPMPEDER